MERVEEKESEKQAGRRSIYAGVGCLEITGRRVALNWVGQGQRNMDAAPPSKYWAWRAVRSAGKLNIQRQRLLAGDGRDKSDFAR